MKAPTCALLNILPLFCRVCAAPFLVAARVGYDHFVDLEVHLFESDFDMPTYHGFHLVHIDAGEFFSVDIEVHIEMAGFVFLDNLEEVPFRGGGFARTFEEGFFSRDDVLARDIVGIDSFWTLAVFHGLAQRVEGVDAVHLWIHTNGCPLARCPLARRVGTGTGPGPKSYKFILGGLFMLKYLGLCAC